LLASQGCQFEVTFLDFELQGLDLGDGYLLESAEFNNACFEDCDFREETLFGIHDEASACEGGCRMLIEELNLCEEGLFEGFLGFLLPDLVVPGLLEKNPCCLGLFSGEKSCFCW
jgi:hypothetical protein